METAVITIAVLMKITTDFMRWVQGRVLWKLLQWEGCEQRTVRTLYDEGPPF
jgi:hypothetical protein